MSRSRLDHKGYGLLLCAIVWGLIGRGVFQGVSNRPNSAIHLLIPTEIRGWMWLAPALLALAAAFVPGLRSWAFVSLNAMPLVQVFSYLWAWLMAVVPGPPPGYAEGWYSAAFHIALIGVVLYVASERQDTTVQDLHDLLRDTGGKPDGLS